MPLIVAISLGIVGVALSSLSNGLSDTSKWAAKVFAPADILETRGEVPAMQFLKVTEASLMEGWLFLIPVIHRIMVYSAIIVGFIHAWWGGIAVLIGYEILAIVARRLFTRPVPYYLTLILRQMDTRSTIYKRENSVELYDSARVYCTLLADLILIYKDCKKKPPGPKQIKASPYGWAQYWLQPEAIEYIIAYRKERLQRGK